MHLISFYSITRLQHVTLTTAVFYGISVIPLIHLKYKKSKRRLFDILCLISKVHINSYYITVENPLYFYSDC